MPMVMQCPFFKRDSYLKLYCESGVVKFPDWQTRRVFVGKFCADIHKWKQCTLASTLEDYYERKDEENERSKRN